MAVLPYGVVVFAGAEEGGWRVDVAGVEDSVDGDGEEVAKCGDYGGVGVEGGFAGGIAGHGMGWAASCFGACGEGLRPCSPSKPLFYRGTKF